ncbi:LamG-like jellyroll fold domain-containing protein [Sedimentisphaera salicampi]|uniref:Immunoglobulin I-set domain protein n=1 Tax=Sedimentisphaera salicampi TaxID=1941349 RepID=A0A1W6LLV3_9BACT|nr:LamG-like jellyroll fold domain-containing protein [Sedimentisphaera salicampi]ARN56732.1 Immunoglobulin I-set domain protein [Sedimentisphaera salicampi]
MFNQRYVLIALAAIMALSFGVYAETVINTDVVWTERTAVQDEADPADGILRIAAGGSITTDDRTDHDRIETDVPSKLILDGGTFTSTNESDGYKFPDNDGPAEIWLNEGTFTTYAMQAKTDEGCKIYVGGGVMIIQSGFGEGGGSPSYDAQDWYDAGMFELQSGYDALVLSDLGDGAVRIEAATGPVNPSPGNNAEVADLNLSQLCWDNYKYGSADVYFGAGDATVNNYSTMLTKIDSTGTIATDGTQVCVDIPASFLPLQAPQTYSWAIEKTSGGDPNTVVYQFETVSIPVVDSQPAPAVQSVQPGETAEFTAIFTSNAGVSGATWYLDGDALSASPVITSLGNDLYEVALTINNAAAGDDGAYTCVAENSAGSSLETEPAYLTVERLIAEWKFDNDLTDTTGNYDGFMPVIDPPVYVEGVNVGDAAGRTALEFPDTEGLGQIVEVPEGFKNFTSGMTLSTWVYLDGEASDRDARILHLTGGVGDIVMRRYSSDQDLRVYFGNEDIRVDNFFEEKSDQWVHIVATLDQDLNWKIYADGEVIEDGDFDDTERPDYGERNDNLIGASDTFDRDDQFVGRIDEIKILNYAMSYEDVLEDYHGVIGGWTCVYNAEYDLAGDDCIVDVQDLAALAAKWLNCGRVPATECP